MAHNLLFLISTFLVWGTGSADLTGLVSPCTFPPLANPPPPDYTLGSMGPMASIDPNSVTMSGFSSGAFMTMQFHIAHSSIIKAAGMFAGGPYGQDYTNSSFPTSSISGGLTWGLLTVNPYNKTVPQLVAQARSFEANGDIDPLSNINGAKAYIFQGTVDPFIQFPEGNRTKEMYETFGANVKYVLLPGATHTVPTDNYGGLCPIFDILHDGVNNCAYEGVFDMFSHILPNFIRPQSSTTPSAAGSSAYWFRQAPFVPADLASTNGFMDQKGYIYVPPGCQDSLATCRLHVALHGCFQSLYNYYDLLPNVFAKHTGYIQVADANNIVMLFPQTAPTCGNLDQANFFCWDYFGATTPDFPFRITGGGQMESVYNMIASLTGRTPIA